MKAGQLNLDELVDFSEGWIGLHGRRLTLRSMHAVAQLREDLIKAMGPDRSRRILTRYGYFWGQADAAAMKRIFEWDTFEEWVRAGARMYTLQGAAQAQIRSLVADRKAGQFRMKITWRNSGEAEEVLHAIGKVDEPACWMSTGYASGYASFCMGKNVYFVEEKCRAKGDRVCSGIGLDEASWGNRLEEIQSYFQVDDIVRTVQMLTRQLQRANQQLAEHASRLQALAHEAKAAFVEVHSKSFRRVIEVARQAARFDSSVLITGETGAGKEVLARYVHGLSKRSECPFVAVNCGALPETLLESELFGHKAGAFTGAVEDRMGLFEYADKGTIFLDEIGDLSPATQMKLLRVLQEHEIVRVGESAPRSIDVRVIAATNRDLEAAVADGAFREDLLYRLRVIEIEVPPLRNRAEDILPLARYFVKQLADKLGLPNLRLDGTCVDYLQRYAWPGNVRELENALERAAVLSENEVILPKYLPPRILHASEGGRNGVVNINRTLAEVEGEHIRAVLRSTGGNRSKAARLLGISPTTLWRKLKQMDAEGVCLPKTPSRNSHS